MLKYFAWLKFLIIVISLHFAEWIVQLVKNFLRHESIKIKTLSNKKNHNRMLSTTVDFKPSSNINFCRFESGIFSTLLWKFHSNGFHNTRWYHSPIFPSKKPEETHEPTEWTVWGTSISRHTILNSEWPVIYSIIASSNFRFNASSSWQQKHSYAVVIATQLPPQIHHSVFPTLALKLNDSASLSLSSSNSVGSSPGKYVGSNWNGWKPLILKRKQQNNEENIHNSTCVYLVSLDCKISVPYIIRQSILLT